MPTSRTGGFRKHLRRHRGHNDLYIGLVPALNWFDRSSAVVLAVLLLVLHLPRAYAAELEGPVELAELKSPKPPPPQPTAQEPGLPPAKSRYTNEKYGISLKFPSNYTLKEGELGNEYTLGYLGPIPMKFTAPGGVRIVTVALPPNSYPETDSILHSLP
jgi:hypothetical protein